MPEARSSGFAGTAFVQWCQERTSRAAERDRAIDATSTAADDLLSGVQPFRNVWARRSYRALLNGAALLMADGGQPAADELKSALIQSVVQSARQALTAVSAEGMVSRIAAVGRRITDTIGKGTP